VTTAGERDSSKEQNKGRISGRIVTEVILICKKVVKSVWKWAYKVQADV
jgi:hypothetical protein